MQTYWCHSYCSHYNGDGLASMLIFDFISILKIEIESIFGEFGKSQQQFDAESRNAFHFHQASERIPIAILILPSTLYAHYLSAYSHAKRSGWLKARWWSTGRPTNSPSMTSAPSSDTTFMGARRVLTGLSFIHSFSKTTTIVLPKPTLVFLKGKTGSAAFLRVEMGQYSLCSRRMGKRWAVFFINSSFPWYIWCKRWWWHYRQ